MMMLVNLYYPLRTPSKVRSLSSNYVSYIKKKERLLLFSCLPAPCPSHSSNDLSGWFLQTVSLKGQQLQYSGALPPFGGGRNRGIQESCGALWLISILEAVANSTACSQIKLLAFWYASTLTCPC